MTLSIAQIQALINYIDATINDRLDDHELIRTAFNTLATKQEARDILIKLLTSPQQ
jgi:hypothetical protein